MARGGGWVIAQMLGLIAVLVLGPLWRGEGDLLPNGVAARFLLILSGAIALAGFHSLGRNLSPHPEPRSSGTLVRHGIYALVRHPLYVSLMVGSFGWALLWQSAPAFVSAVLVVIVLDGKARFEERRMRERFPGYEEYARRVRRFIPGLY
jgi:protein-S-isoprenylcysteine O-methyltransferase Ste14